MTTAPLTCVEFVEIVTEYLEGTMTAQDRKRFDEHLAQCHGCTAYLEQIRETIRAVGLFTEEDLPAPARMALLDAFRDWSSTDGGTASASPARGLIARFRSWRHRVTRERRQR